MKLYFSRGACSLAPHILLRETRLQFELERVDLSKHQLADGSDYYAINSRGQVPVLEMNDGERLTEGPVIAQFIAERAGRPDLLPPSGGNARYRVLEWQNYITSELHKTFTPLFRAAYPDEVKELTRETLRKNLAWVAEQLAGRAYLTGDTFTVADPYLFVILSWTKYAHIDISELETLTDFQKRIAERPATAEALRAEEQAD